MAKRMYVSFEVCDAPCAYENKTCLFISRDKGNSYCGRARIREMPEEWVCERCGRTLGLRDTRHEICIPPPEELDQRIAKAYLRIIRVCDSCMKRGEELFEIFRLS